ncbi:MAG: 2-oxo acid dehydrogenase subunit E2 [Caldilineaceae bacterium]
MPALAGTGEERRPRRTAPGGGTQGSETGNATVPVAVLAWRSSRACGQRTPHSVSPLARKLVAELGVDLDHGRHRSPRRHRPPTQSGAVAQRAAPQRAAAQRRRRRPKRRTSQNPCPRPLLEGGRTAHGETDAQAAPAKPARAADDFQTGMRRAIALAMAKVQPGDPTTTWSSASTCANALRWLEAENQQRPSRIGCCPGSSAQRPRPRRWAKVPQLNGFWLDDRLQVSEAIHIGFAIALRQGGLITPAIHHTDLLDMDELMAAVRDLIMRTRFSVACAARRFIDATIVLTSLGDMGVDKVYGVIYPPQVAPVGFGKTADEVWCKTA